MIYLFPQSTHDGPMITTPGHKGLPSGIVNGSQFAVDNEAFTRGFDPGRYFPYLEMLAPYRANCLFVTVPDVVGDSIQTLSLYRQWVRHFEGWPIAFVAQDGQENLPLPGYYDWLFIGGSTEWKMSPASDDCIRRAKADGKRVHIGRVNSEKRFKHFQLIGADSCDGTNPTFEPDRAKKRWSRMEKQMRLITV